MPNSLYSDLCDVYDEGTKPYLFISYSHEDTAKVVAAIRALQRVGYRIWYDMGISAGAQWPEDVADHIFGCDAVLAFMTPNSILSDNCREELFYAKKLKKDILLAYLEQCDLSHGMDMRLGMLQAIEHWRCKDDEEFYTRLAKAKILFPCRGEIEGGDSTGAAPAQAPAADKSKQKTKIDALREKAEKGNAQAQADLAWAYNQGNGVEKDPTEAVKWYTKAAEQGHRIAQNNLGVMYSQGQGVPQNYEESVKWYRKAADQKYPSALRWLGLCYEHGRGVEKDEQEAVRLYQQALDLGYVEAANALGCCYEQGIGVEKDMGRAFAFYTQAAELGDRYAQQNLALCYEHSKGVEQDWDRAAHWYRKSAEQGLPYPQKKMAELCRKGLGVPVDEAEADRWQKRYDENPDK